MRVVRPGKRDLMEQQSYCHGGGSSASRAVGCLSIYVPPSYSCPISIDMSTQCQFRTMSLASLALRADCQSIPFPWVRSRDYFKKGKPLQLWMGLTESFALLQLLYSIDGELGGGAFSHVSVLTYFYLFIFFRRFFSWLYHALLYGQFGLFLVRLYCVVQQDQIYLPILYGNSYMMRTSEAINVIRSVSGI